MKHLQKTRGITYSIVHPGYTFRNILHFLRIYLSALLFPKKGSVIILQKLYTNNVYVRLLKILARVQKTNTLYDTDDADYLRYPSDNIHFFMKACSDCSTGSEDLATYILRFNPRVALFSSPVIEHSHHKERRNELFTLGWVGEYDDTDREPPVYSHVNSLHTLVFPAIKKIDFPCQLIMLGVANKKSVSNIQKYFMDNTNIKVIAPLHLDWLNEESIYSAIKNFDAGLSPLVDHEFNRAKSAFKLKQYLSCGVPVLASPTGENKRFLRHARNGYICANADEYYKSILDLKQLNEEEYWQMSQAALATARDLSVKNYSDTLVAYLESR